MDKTYSTVISQYRKMVYFELLRNSDTGPTLNIGISPLIKTSKAKL